MYKVMIVDDEPEIRKSIIMKMDWSSLGLAVAQEASNGIEALGILESVEIDILITDMNMPFMDGVEFLKQCSSNFPKMKRIVLTGYKDMAYIKAAIHSKACDFLLKPIIRHEMIDALQKVIHELSMEKSEEQTRKSALLKMSEYQDTTAEALILKTVKEEWDHAADLDHKAKQLQMARWLDHHVQFVCVEIANRSEDEGRKLETFRLPFELLCRECKEHWPVLVFRDLNYPNMMQFIYSLQETDELTEIESFEKDIRAIFEKYLRLNLFIGIGVPVQGLKEWRRGYLSALLDWSRRNHAIQSNSPSVEATLTIDQTKLLSHFINSCEFEQFQAIVREILEHANNHSKQMMIRVIFQIFILIETTAYSNGVMKDQEQYLWLQPEKAHELATVIKASQFLCAFADKVMKEIQKNAAHTSTFMAEEIKSYIDVNYANNINLGMLAEKYHFNASYFSDLFKTKMGLSFMDYLNNIRMNKAAQLLLTTSLRTADIAELTGFSNASYFSTVFKKYFGINPTDFRSIPQNKSMANEDI